MRGKTAHKELAQRGFDSFGGFGSSFWRGENIYLDEVGWALVGAFVCQVITMKE